MENMYNDIDDLFREELSEHAEVPPPRVWNALEQRLDKDKKRRVFPFRWYWFVGLLFFITVLAGYFALTDGSDVGNGGAITNVAGASVTAPVAPSLNSVSAAESSDRVSVNSDTKKVDVERNAAVKSDQKKVKSLRSKKAVKEEDRKEAKNMSVEGEKSTANAPTVGTSMYSYDEFDEPETPRNIDVAHADVKQYASAARGGKHKIAVAELPEVLNEVAAKPEEVAAATTRGEKMVSETSSEPGEIGVDKNTQQHKPQLAKTHVVVRKNLIKKAVSVRAAKGTQSSVQSAATNKTSVAKKMVGVKGISDKPAEKPVNAIAIATSQPSTVPASAGGKKGIVKHAAGLSKVAGGGAETTTNGRQKIVATPSNAERGSLSGTANGRKVAHDEVVSGKKLEKEKEDKPAVATQASKGNDLLSAKGVRTTGKSVVEQPTIIKQVEAGKVVAANGIAADKKVVGVAKKEAMFGKGVVADDSEEDAVSGKAGSNTMVSSKGKVSSASMVAANIPVVKAKPAVEAKTSGKPQTGKAGTEDEAGDTTQLAIAVQAAKSETVKKTEETKQPEAIDSVVAGNKEDSATDNMSKLTKWAVGLKGGFEMALVGAGSSKIAFSPFIQYRLGKKFSIMVQPAIKGVRQPERTVGATGNYYESKSGTGSYKLVDSALLYLVMTGDTLWRRNYEYTEKYDSIVKTYKTGGTYLEFELPVLLRFDVTPKLGVYGGLNMVYSKKQGVHEETKVWTDQVARGEVSTLLPVNAAATLPTTTGLNYTGTPLANYSGPTYPDDRSGLMRMGYMLGVSYEFKKRWLADAILQQSFVPANVQGGTDLNKPLGLPYIRLTIGYRFGDK